MLPNTTNVIHWHAVLNKQWLDVTTIPNNNIITWALVLLHVHKPIPNSVESLNTIKANAVFYSCSQISLL